MLTIRQLQVPSVGAVRAILRLIPVDNYLVTGRNEGMITFDESVRRLYKAELITKSTAERNVTVII